MNEQANTRGELPPKERVNSEEIAQLGNLLEEKEPVSEFGDKKRYKYPEIKLRLNEDREKLLKDCCEIVGIDKTRVDSHQADVIWEILRWTLPALRIRRYLMELVGPVINCTPEREKTKEVKQ